VDAGNGDLGLHDNREERISGGRVLRS
jgi:hypothetical protein